MSTTRQVVENVAILEGVTFCTGVATSCWWYWTLRTVSVACVDQSVSGWP